MPVKCSIKINKKNANDDEKENSDESIVNNAHGSDSKVDGKSDSGSTNDILVKLADDISKDLDGSSNTIENQLQDKQFKIKDVDANSSSMDISSEHAEIDPSVCGNINSSVDDSINSKCKGKKRLFEVDDEHPNDLNVNSNTPQHASYADYIIIKKKCVELETRVTKIEEESLWTVKPTELNQHLPNTVNVLQDVEKRLHPRHSFMTHIVENLGMDEKELKACHGKSATATARRIMAFKYANASTDLKLSQIDVSIIHAIICYVSYSNPTDDASEAKVRRSISLYCSAKTYKAKKAAKYSSNRPIEELNNDTDNEHKGN